MKDDKDLMDRQMEPEVPIIIIEREDEPVAPISNGKVKGQRLKIALLLLAMLGAVVILFFAYRQWAYYNRLGIPVSVSPQQNIEKLKAGASQETPEVVMTSDSILGVGLDIYALKGLQGSIEFEEPDTADASVFFYCRSSDFTAEGRYLGSLVSKGKLLENSNSRLGYMAMAHGANVIGIARSEAVRDYVEEQGGSFFRQFVLVSDGELPPRFHLHGKVERCALGRMGDDLYFITSRQKETLWSFADALREYGFSDAIYITGGKDYSYYRDRTAVRHDIHDVAGYPHKKWKGIIPWLVFRKCNDE